MRDDVVETVRSYVGLHLGSIGEDQLADLYSRSGLDKANAIVSPHVSTCGLFGLGIWFKMGVKHSLLTTPYKTGMAIAWLREIAHDLNAIRKPSDGLPSPGSLLHYFTKGHNNNHVEFVLSQPQVIVQQWRAEHAGGGRALAGVGSDTSDILWSSGRPLQEWFDIDALLPEVTDDAYGPEEPPTAR